MADELTDGGPPLRVQREVVFDAAFSQNVLEKRFVGRLTLASITPSVKNCENWIAQNTGAVLVTDFLDGQPGQRLFILGDGQTTVQHGTKIFTQSGADTLLASDTAYQFVKFGANWYQI